MVLMKAQPSLIAKSVSSVVLATWEPAATIQYYCALSQLTFLCGCVDVDSQFKLAMKTLVTSVLLMRTQRKLQSRQMLL